MILLDANLLIYAVNRDAPLHGRAKRWLEEALAGPETVAFSWNVLLLYPDLISALMSRGRAVRATSPRRLSAPDIRRNIFRNIICSNVSDKP